MNEKIMYTWLIILTIIIMLMVLIPNNSIEIKGIRGSLDDLWDEVGHIRVKTNKLHMMINETNWDEWFKKCWDGKEYTC